jgi:transcriptional regulator with XRE-family HTH domain
VSVFDQVATQATDNGKKSALAWRLLASVATEFPCWQQSKTTMNTANLLLEEIQPQLRSFGARLRELRTQRGWTLQDLAAQSGLSKTFLSRLESGDRQASIAAVLTLSRIFDVSLASLFESPLATDPCVIVRQGEMAEQTSKGLTYAPLSRAGRFFNVQPMRVRVSPSRRGKEMYHHDGEEWIYVLSGALTLSLAGRMYDLEPGDAAHFDSRLPHRLSARGTRDAEVLVVASPLSGSLPFIPPPGRQYRAIPAMPLLNFRSQRALPPALSRGGARCKPTNPPGKTKIPPENET